MRLATEARVESRSPCTSKEGFGARAGGVVSVRGLPTKDLSDAS